MANQQALHHSQNIHLFAPIIISMSSMNLFPPNKHQPTAHSVFARIPSLSRCGPNFLPEGFPVLQRQSIHLYVLFIPYFAQLCCNLLLQCIEWK